MLLLLQFFSLFAVAAAALNGCYVTQVRPGQQYHQRYTTAITTTTTTISNGHYQPKYNSKWNFTHSLLINRLISLSSLLLAIHCSICSRRAGFLGLWVWICARMELQCMSQLLVDFKKQNICLLLLNWDSQWFCCCQEPHASRPKGPHIAYRLAYDNRLSICLSDNPFVFLILASVCFYFSVCGSLSPWLCWRFLCTMGYSTTFANGPRVLMIHRNHRLSQHNIHWKSIANIGCGLCMVWSPGLANPSAVLYETTQGWESGSNSIWGVQILSNNRGY